MESLCDGDEQDSDQRAARRAAADPSAEYAARLRSAGIRVAVIDGADPFAAPLMGPPSRPAVAAIARVAGSAFGIGAAQTWRRRDGQDDTPAAPLARKSLPVFQPDRLRVAEPLTAARHGQGVQRRARQRVPRRLRAAVPDDLLLVAGVDSHEASTGDPPITALDLHPDEQAAIAVELLIARVNGENTACPARCAFAARALRGTAA